MISITAKMKVQTVTLNGYDITKVYCRYSDTPENNLFPSGNMELVVDNAKAYDFFRPLKKYRITITEAK